MRLRTQVLPACRFITGRVLATEPPSGQRSFKIDGDKR
jgi:hypothetical protein